MIRVPKTCRVFVLFLLAACWASPRDASAAAFRHAKNFVLAGTETVHDDLYAAGTVVDIQGTVDGDLVAAGQTILIGGDVTGDVIAAARDVTISGKVGGTIRATGSVITISGAVGHDVVVGCGTLVVGQDATIGRDVLAGSKDASFGGRITRDVRAGAKSATFSGKVGGMVYAHAQEIQLAEGAVLEQDLIYTSKSPVVKAEGAIVRGRVEQRVPEEHEGRKGPFAGSPVIGWLKGLIGLTIFGFLFFALFSGAGRRTLDALARAPWPSLGVGTLIAFGVPFAAMFFFLFGIFFGGWWIGLGVLVLYFFALALGYVASATLVGRWLLARAGRGAAAFGWALTAGLAVVGLATAIPFLGRLIGSFAVLFGLGAMAIAWNRSRRSDADSTPAPAPSPVPKPPAIAPVI
jgi:cytoskeletal protein CcmA (bactofilin family)